MTASLTLEIAEYAASTSAAKIPAEVKERAKLVIFDEMACAHFCRRSPAGALASRYAASTGSPPEARILGTNLRVSAPYAALANGTSGHGEEVDGAHVQGGHPGASIVHANVAMAERQRSTGGDLINAVVLAYDIGARAMQACGGIFQVKTRYHLHADFLYAVGATVGAGRLLGLDPLRHCHAMALATFQINGLYALYSEKRHISKSFCNGQYAFAGVSAPLMAAVGLEGHEDIIGTDRGGLLDAWGIENGRELVARALGQEFAIMGANFKFFNAGYPIHAAVEAAMTLVRTHSLDVDSIKSVHVGMPENAMRVVDGRTMHNICLQDILSAALVLGGIRLDQSPFPAVLSNPSFASLRPGVTLGVDPGLNRDQPNGRGSNVTITTKDGSTVSHRVDHPRGHSARGGATWDDLAEKWKGMLVGCDLDRALTVAQGLDDLEDVNQLSAHFVGPQY